MTPQEERNKRFDEKFKGFILQEPSEVYVSFDGIKSNLTSEVNLAIEQVEKWAKRYFSI
jgi:hypothetical protein